MEILQRLLEAGKISQDEFSQIKTDITAIESQRDEARQESANRRIKLKELETYKSFVDEIAKNKNVDLQNGLDDLKKVIYEVPAKGGKTDDEFKSLQEKYLEDKKKWESNYQKVLQEKEKLLVEHSLGNALQPFDFRDINVALKLASEKVVNEEGVVKYNDNGVYIPLDEGLKKFASDYEWMLNPKGKTGSGNEHSNTGNNAPKTLTEMHLQQLK